MKTRKSIVLIGFMLLILSGYVFFWTSDGMMSSVDTSLYTAIGTTEKISKHSITLARWEYSPNQHVMEVELSLQNQDFDNLDKYRFQVKTNPGGQFLNVAPIIEEPDLLICHIEGVPADFSEMVLRVGLTENEEMGINAPPDIVKFYTNAAMVQVVDTVEALTLTGYKIRALHSQIEFLSANITKNAEEIQVNESRRTYIDEQNAKLEADKAYQTVKQMEETNRQISENESTKKMLSSTNERLAAENAEIAMEIENIRMKISDMQTAENTGKVGG